MESAVAIISYYSMTRGFANAVKNFSVITRNRFSDLIPRKISDLELKKLTSVPAFISALRRGAENLSPSELKLRQRSARLELNDLRQGLSNAQDSLSTEEWIQACIVIDIWGALYSFLLRLQQLFLNLEKILIFWAKVLYLLLLFSHISEFPNSLRPPCTTMPWTIWPALVVLWGVCWMFYTPCDLDWEAGQFEDANPGYQMPSQYSLCSYSEKGTHLLPDLDSIPPNFNYNAPNLGERQSDSLDLEQQLQQFIPEPAVNFWTPTSIGSVLTSSTVNPQDTIAVPISTDGVPHTTAVAASATSYNVTNAPQEATEDRRLEGAESRADATLLEGACSTTTDGLHTNPSRKSKHGQIEKYHCPYPDCNHSRPGAGFRRKDHLDQHLRGPHKQSSVARVRAKPAAAVTSSRKPSATTQTIQAPPQSQKRKRVGDGELDARSVEELAEERRLRLIVLEEENQGLRRKLERCEEQMEKYEQRLEKYEERLDGMMTLFGGEMRKT